MKNQRNVKIDGIECVRHDFRSFVEYHQLTKPERVIVAAATGGAINGDYVIAPPEIPHHFSAQSMRRRRAIAYAAGVLTADDCLHVWCESLQMWCTASKMADGLYQHLSFVDDPETI